MYYSEWAILHNEYFELKYFEYILMLTFVLLLK